MDEFKSIDDMNEISINEHAKFPISSFTDRINSLRENIIAKIISMLRESNLSEIKFDGIINQPTYVLWCGNNGTWYDSPVTNVSLAENGIGIDVKDDLENVSTTLYSKDVDLAFDNLFWLKNICNNVMEAIEATTNLKNDIQCLLLKKWNLYLKDNDNVEPRYACVSIRFKDGDDGGEKIISLTDFSEETTDHIFHYVQSLQELIELADTNKEATMQSFIITGINEYSENFSLC